MKCMFKDICYVIPYNSHKFNLDYNFIPLYSVYFITLCNHLITKLCQIASKNSVKCNNNIRKKEALFALARGHGLKFIFSLVFLKLRKMLNVPLELVSQHCGVDNDNYHTLHSTKKHQKPRCTKKNQHVFYHSCA